MSRSTTYPHVCTRAILTTGKRWHIEPTEDLPPLPTPSDLEPVQQLLTEHMQPNLAVEATEIPTEEPKQPITDMKRAATQTDGVIFQSELVKAKALSSSAAPRPVCDFSISCATC